MNEATQWRLDLARRVGAAYAADRAVAAVYVAGSVARGWADRYSDVELDVYWHEPPSDAQRLRAIERAGALIDVNWAQTPSAREYRAILQQLHGHVSQLWPHEGSEWSEHFYVQGVNLGVSAFLVATLNGWIEDVVDRLDTDDEKHMRIAAVQHAVPLHGEEQIARWQAAIRFPDRLGRALVAEQLAIDEAWWQCDMLAGRQALIPLADLLSAMARRVLRILLAVNRLFLPDPRFKWADRLMGQMAVAPTDLSHRLRWVFRAEPAAAVAELQRLMQEVLDLVDVHMPGLDTAAARILLDFRRVEWEQPPT
jgi:predicted nucleotidyltransferase